MDIKNQFIQQSAGDSELVCACGAFCVKYWQWHSGQEDSQIVNQENEILNTYNRIKFGDKAKKFNFPSEWGNPFAICRECGGTLFFDIRDDFIAPLAKAMHENVTDVPITEKELTLEIGQYSILILKSEQNPQHYILIYRQSDDEYYYHDPVSLHPLPLENGIPKYGDNISYGGLTYMGAGIILPRHTK